MTRRCWTKQGRSRRSRRRQTCETSSSAWAKCEHSLRADNSIDVVISNCVINLSPDKPQVWREIYRVLKPGGTACVSDLALKEELPAEVKASVQAHLGCVAGAVRIEKTVEMMQAAGLTDVTFRDKPGNMDAMDGCNDALYKVVRELLPEGEAKRLRVQRYSRVARRYETGGGSDRRVKRTGTR